jgi:hypothetical protein
MTNPRFWQAISNAHRMVEIGEARRVDGTSEGVDFKVYAAPGPCIRIDIPTKEASIASGPDRELREGTRDQEQDHVSRGA